MHRREYFSRIVQSTVEPPISQLMQTALTNPDLISLAAGFVDQATLPVDIVRQSLTELLGRPHAARRALQYGTTIGDADLRRCLLRRLESEEGLAEDSLGALLGRTIVTTGSQQLLYLIAEALLDPGDIVLVESPSYFVFLGVLESRGVRMIGVDIDEGGLCLDSLRERLTEIDDRGDLERVKLIYTVSEHGNPSGLCLEESRRGPLVEMARNWSRHHPILILEDAAYRGLTYVETEPRSVWSHDPAGDHVILARTFSKTLSPGLKLGYGILPAPLARAVLALKGNHDFGSSNFVQMLLEHVLQDGSYDQQMSLLRETYERKCRVILRALSESFRGHEGQVTWTTPRGGIYVWMTFPPEISTDREGALFERCLAEGVLYVPGSYSFAPEPGPVPTNHARICFGVPGDDELIEGVRRLSAAYKDCLSC